MKKSTTIVSPGLVSLLVKLQEMFDDGWRIDSKHPAQMMFTQMSANLVKDVPLEGLSEEEREAYGKTRAGILEKARAARKKKEASGVAQEEKPSDEDLGE
jgi:hypothetical protein